MELAIPTKPQQNCNTDKIRLIEYVREFELPQQFPSMVTTKKNDIMTCKNGNITNTSDPTIMSSTASKFLKIISHTQFPCKLRKLRIVSPNGKDLGEFNVILQTDQENPLKRKSVKSNNWNSFGHVNEPVTTSLSPISNLSKKPVPQILSQDQDSIKTEKDKPIKSNLTDLTLCGKTVPKPNKIITKISQQQSTISINKTLVVNQDIKVNKGVQNFNSNIRSGKVVKLISLNREQSKSIIKGTIHDIGQKFVKLRHKPVISVEGNKYKIYDLKNLPELENSILKSVKNENSASTIKNREVTTARKTVYKEIAESQLPIVSCKKLKINTSDDSVQMSEEEYKICKYKSSATVTNTENRKITYLQSILKPVANSSQINKNLNEKCISNSSTKYEQVTENNNKLCQEKCYHQINQTYGMKTQENITIKPNDKTLSFNNNGVQKCNITTENDKDITKLDNDKDRNDVTCHNDTHSKNISNKEAKNKHLSNYMVHIPKSEIVTNAVDLKTSSITQNNDCPEENITDTIDINMQTNLQENDCSGNLTPEGLSDQWNIIKKAVNTIKDKDLRAQALNALKDCGIGIEKQVPIQPEKVKTVHDSQIQTAVFGLLEPEWFILIDNETDNIQRIQQTTSHNRFIAQDSLLEDHLHLDSNFNSTNETGLEIDFDIDAFLNQIDSESVLKVEETLSIINTKYEKILKQLQKDFESANQYDQNGMLNIHKAVIRDNVFDTQRHLMVLKQCKESVDILTKDGMTSLELAIKHDVSSKIVKLLLQAGAQPVIPKLTHESALIIASKQSSSLLPMLISYVSDMSLLNQIYSEGFAALHYCCIHGNLEGVNALLSAGATIDLKDNRSGRTPLFHALDNNYRIIAQRLLNAGAVTSIANYAGQLPLTIVNSAPGQPTKLLVKRNIKTVPFL